jgi:hypothetical protein
VSNVKSISKDVDFLKGVLAIFWGVFLALLTPTIHDGIPYPYSDALLVILYFMNYFITTPIVNHLIGLRTWRKGLSIFFSLEFIAWVSVYEAIITFIS